ncbi:hypothetical protein [Kribbella sp. NPDC000426]|uniref:hypothetical protein n=1 Tax=Kribbella sp. NPDC000426 TaxID=3154255 RepID=UPI003322DBD0
MSTLAVEGPFRQVRVWLGEHLVIDHISETDTAASFEEAMRRRFPSLRVTNEAASAVDQ